jgi:hypothetical protein
MSDLQRAIDNISEGIVVLETIEEGKRMTREEAALVRLRLMAHRAFGAMVEENRRGGSEEAQKDLDAIDLAIATIQSKIARPQPDPDTGPEGCWHCRNIEAHHIEYVIAVKAKGGTPMNMPVDCPYHYCPACGRKLGVKG